MGTNGVMAVPIWSAILIDGDNPIDTPYAVVTELNVKVMMDCAQVEMDLMGTDEKRYHVSSKFYNICFIQATRTLFIERKTEDGRYTTIRDD